MEHERVRGFPSSLPIPSPNVVSVPCAYLDTDPLQLAEGSLRARSSYHVRAKPAMRQSSASRVRSTELVSTLSASKLH